MGLIIFPEIRSQWAAAPNAPVLVSSGTQPSLGTTGAVAACFWRRRGPMCDIQIFLQFGSVSMGVGTGSYNVDFTIPKWDGSAGQESMDQNWNIDNFYLSSYPSSFLRIAFNDVSSLGRVELSCGFDNSQPTRINNITTISAAGTYTTQGVAWSATAPVVPAAGDQLSIVGSFAVLGWS